MTLVAQGVLSKKKPEKNLLRSLNKTGGRGYKGRITSWHRGGGHRRKYRLMDFKGYRKEGVPAKVMAIEYDPNRSAFIALVFYADGSKVYVLSPSNLKVGDQIVCQPKAALDLGNRMHVGNIPVGTAVHNVELTPSRGGQLGRTAGSAIYVMAHEGGWTHLKLPSGEIRMVKDVCWASVGQLGNMEHSTMVLGKAGRARWMGKRPEVRGTAMNPCDHPHGGGEQRQPIGLRRGPKTPWGKLAYGVKTRKKKKPSSRFILSRRKSKR